MVNKSGISGMRFPRLLVQGTLVLHQSMALPVFLAQTATERITYRSSRRSSSTCSSSARMLEAADLSSIRRIGSGSAPLARWMTTGWKERHRIDILNFFGSNEGVTMVAAPSGVADAGERAPSATCSPD
jgi:acyl-coenzyme A synthetase/AMP-(fatty) acid ligase